MILAEHVPANTVLTLSLRSPPMIVSIFMVLCIFLLQPPTDSGDLIKSIERQQGGRHWIDQPTEPPKSPEESLACFQIEPGYRIELVAAEPIITDPVAIDFDLRGRMFVVEYTDYPVGPKDPAALPCRCRRSCCWKTLTATVAWTNARCLLLT